MLVPPRSNRWLLSFSQFGICALVLVSATPLLAQKSPAEIPPPSPPFVAPPPEFSCWTITAKGTPDKAAQEDAGKSAAPIVQALSTVTKEIKQVKMLSADGKQKELWYCNNSVVTPADNDTSKVVIMDAGGSGPPPDGSMGSLIIGSGFPGLWWINLNCYKDVATSGGRPCYHYVLAPAAQQPAAPVKQAPVKKVIGGTVFTSEDETPTPNRIKPLEAEAWIDVETKLPVAVRTGGLFYEYKYLTPPSAPLALPPAMSTAVKLDKSTTDRLKLLEKRR